ncbi:hypothetical protein U8326_14975 [Tsuneonella sp. CC-YZS046]|uniref:hypothetical protein n=1 Tax=Tsuneonella sp. CC-YZS046 TaxID=3042152 RepID=UPI002D767571|nr:hypothetical protein [Tsuneonella sp. CC-YZS046]WRO66320.1 hypothetical protein U8326_14975 [Tsuneonella sp. CC-YZS046]
MKIFEFCMFHNEHPALALKMRESAKWVDELHLCEANRTFRHGERSPALPPETVFLKPHLFDGASRFHPACRWGFSRYFPFFRKKEMARRNETSQRNHVHEVLAGVADDDLVILSDVDEIVDSRRAGEVIDAARRHGIVSIEMHHTFFYLNLYSTNFHEVWKHSPANYAYRTFAMTGAAFRTLRHSSDRLRRLGEWGRLHERIFLLRGFHGFHHSWLGDEQAALEKLRSYSHSLGEHAGELAGPDGEISHEALRNMMREGRSLYEGNRLEVKDFSEIPPLQAVTDDLETFGRFILDKRSGGDVR